MGCRLTQRRAGLGHARCRDDEHSNARIRGMNPDSSMLDEIARRRSRRALCLFVVV